MSSVFRLWFLVAITSLPACGVTPPEAIPVAQEVAIETLHASVHCEASVLDVKTSWYSNEEQLSRAYSKLRKGRHHSTRRESAELPVVDFNHAGVVLVEMGHQPTLGYRLILRNAVATVIDNRAEVVVEWSEPPDGMMVGQAMTSPCLMLKVGRGEYREIWIMDQQGQRRSSAAVIWNKI